MDALIGNLKTHEMNRNYDLSKKEAKKDKSLMLKCKSVEDSSDDDMAYLISRFQKIVKKNKVYKRGTNGTRNAAQSDTCYKCGKAGHFIRECPLLKNESKEHQKPRSDKENRRDLVLGKRDRKATADLVVKKALAAWGDYSSDSEDPDEPNDVSMVAVHEEETVFNEMFALMAHTADEEEDNQLTYERDTMNAELDSLTENKVKLEEKMSRMVSLESNNSELKNQSNQITEEAEKLNGMSNGLQAEIQEKLKISEKKLGVSLEKSNKLEHDIVSERSSSQCWYMDSGCSKHMTGDVNNFLSLKTLQGEGVSFGDGKKGYFLGVGKVGRSLEDSIDNVYHVDGLTYSLLSVSQISDKGNEVKFTYEKCTVVSLTTKKVILTAHRSKNMYVANLETSHGDDLACLSAQNENADLWHRRLGH
ncbi:sporulation-specific protein 15-like [Solanum lycopersicum]|uniref:sporulation-specific protein 15-like n=1 Tax=Solanum lycopersicum TaxID=4081 RepID=UPI0037493DE4